MKSQVRVMAKLTKAKRAEIVHRAQQINPDGSWKEKYDAIAMDYGVSRCMISHIVLKAGLIRGRKGFSRKGPIQIYSDPELKTMYLKLRGKVGAWNARLLVNDHVKIRGLAA